MNFPLRAKEGFVLSKLIRFGEYGTVSQNMGLYINLDKPIDCKILCKKIGEYIQGYKKSSGKDKDLLLSINISNISHTSIEHIQTIEDKSQEPKDS